MFPLSGIILCGDCGGAMVRKTNTAKGVKYPYYVCGKHRADKNVCTTHIVSARECENAVLQALRLHTSAVLDVEKALACAESMKYRQDGVRKLTARLEAKQDEIKRYNEFRLSLHESYREGVISKVDFLTFKSSYDVKLAEAESVVLQLKEDIERMAAGEAESHDWINKFRAYSDCATLERKTVAELIDSVIVYEGGRIEVKFRFYNEFERLQTALREAA
ncbi:hypothetical protein FACS189425_02080 [Clostridia bacterium]|nr:hypothetical protein FACS189425_02080 [Clostridia bacterium]